MEMENGKSYFPNDFYLGNRNLYYLLIILILNSYFSISQRKIFIWEIGILLPKIFRCKNPISQSNFFIWEIGNYIINLIL